MMIGVVCILGLLFLAADDVTSASVNVTTSFGVIEGLSRDLTVPDGTRYHVGLFLGIPYAKAPVGSLRFQKPVLKLSPGPFYRAHVESKACPQNVVMLNGWVPGPPDMSEDCLKLNVYVPMGPSGVSTSNGTEDLANQVNRSNKKAVMIWIHGGAYVIGQSRIYDAQRLAGVGDIIVVTINYRLGSLGFLTTGDGVVRGNAGLWDQQAAITWVKENIASFGGDPERITLSGESAGGASSIYQLLYPGNKGKIARVAVSSGTALCPWAFSRESTAKYATRLAARVGCGYEYLPGFSVERHVKMIRCLQSKPFEVIVNNSNVGSMTETLFRAEWVPTVDGEFLKEAASEIFKWIHEAANTSSNSKRSSSSLVSGNGPLTGLDAMVGSNYDDGEVVAKITVRNLVKTIADIDFEDANMTSEIIEKIYFPQIVIDHFGRSNPAVISAFSRAYRDSLNETLGLDGNFFTPRLEALQEILESTTDYEFLMPAIQTIASMANSNTVTSALKSPRHFLYRFDRKYPTVPRPEWNRNAAHGDDLPYIFGFPSSMSKAFNITDDVEKREWKTSKTIMTYWTNFVKSGDPNKPEQVPTPWLQFQESEMNYLLFTENMSSANYRTNLYPERIRLWRDTMKGAGQV